MKTRVSRCPINLQRVGQAWGPEFAAWSVEHGCAMAEANGAIDTIHRLQQRCEQVFRDPVVTGTARGDAVLRRLPEQAVVALRND